MLVVLLLLWSSPFEETEAQKFPEMAQFAHVGSLEEQICDPRICCRANDPRRRHIALANERDAEVSRGAQTCKAPRTILSVRNYCLCQFP